uniref:AlNc14C387G11268 protein n=1 Tax=Albugo laibachii Nc14 TaxID=890382 RepID=F0WYK5_9STRA|nr:AlNc14C387G11268 [Albugo laibachii Nc14]|eukprot:CCA26563.1 AlNc14C387G11268 [Albugo laibachii Nc14]
MDDVSALSALVVPTERADAYCWSAHPLSRRQRLIAPDGRVDIEQPHVLGGAFYSKQFQHTCVITSSCKNRTHCIDIRAMILT